MGISYTREDHRWVANQRVVVLEATFDNSYTAGGEPLNPEDANLGRIEHVDVVDGVLSSGHVLRYDPDADALLVYEEADTASGMSELADGSADIDGETVRVRVWGRS